MKRQNIFGPLLFILMVPSVCAQLAPANPAVAGKAGAASSKNQVTVQLTQRKVIKSASGTEQFAEAGSVRPNDVIEYRATYTNTGDRPVKGLVATLPIPEGLDYQPKSAKPSTGVQVALKDGPFGAEPLMHKGVDGKDEPVTYVEYRTLRWSVGQLGAHASVVVSARARVESVVPKTAVVDGASVPQAPPAAKP